MTLAAGSRLGPYEIVSPLGAGGMGELYRARDTRLERTVAVSDLAALASAHPRYDVARDGKKFLVTTGVPQELSPITVLTNGTAELEKKQ